MCHALVIITKNNYLFCMNWEKCVELGKWLMFILTLADNNNRYDFSCVKMGIDFRNREREKKVWNAKQFWTSHTIIKTTSITNIRSKTKREAHSSNFIIFQLDTQTEITFTYSWIDHQVNREKKNWIPLSEFMRFMLTKH